MTNAENVEQLSEERRMAVFSALVKAQDELIEVIRSRKLIIEQFGVTELQLKQIEREGLDRQWPPLEP